MFYLIQKKFWHHSFIFAHSTKKIKFSSLSSACFHSSVIKEWSDAYIGSYIILTPAVFITYIETSDTDHPVNIIFHSTIARNLARHWKRHRRADYVCGNLWDLWKFLDCGEVFTMISKNSLIKGENIIFNIKFLAHT